MAKSIIEAEFSFGLVKVVVFASPPRENRENTYRTLGVSRAYKDAASGAWKYTSSFDVRDALVLQNLIDQAVEYIVAREQAESAERQRRRKSKWSRWTEQPERVGPVEQAMQSVRRRSRAHDEILETDPPATDPPPANEDIPF